MDKLMDKILGTLYGMAVGDAMGMPPELWSRKKTKEAYPYIDTFLNGNPQNVISYQYQPGQFTDDTGQALVVLDSLIANDFQVNKADLANRLIAWAKKENAFEMNILGPTSRQVLAAIINGEDPVKLTSSATTNGAAMRIAPVGTLFTPQQSQQLCRYTASICAVTHSSDIAIASACMIAMAVSSALAYADREQMIRDALSVEQYALSLGASTPTPSIGVRTRWAVEQAGLLKDRPEAFYDELYYMVGASTAASESTACALAMAYYHFDVCKCAKACAVLGGDTDTIGAMATAICGAAHGLSSFPTGWQEKISQANDVDLSGYAKLLYERHGKLA